MKKTLLPQEVETFYVIPTLRRYFAQFMKESGMKQKEIATIFDVNTSTISQYTSTKRGHKIHFDKETISEIKRCIPEVKNTFAYIKQTQHLLNYIRKTRALCTIHHQLSDLPANCTPEEVGCHARERICP